MNTSLPTASERIAERARASRAAGAWDQATVAALLTSMGSPTKVSTVTRIEADSQPATIEQVLLLSLLMGGGLRELLQPPFSLGDLTVRTEADLDLLLAGEHIDHLGHRISTPLDEEVGKRTSSLWDDRRHRQIAETVGATPRRVQNAAERLYGHGADREISQRFHARLAEVSPQPGPETAAWRAYRSHAVRAVTSEIGEAL